MSYSLAQDGTYTTALPTGKDAGTYEVWYKATLGESVIAGPDCVEVEISRKSVTVTANDLSKDFGETDPALTYEAVGLVNGETGKKIAETTNGNGAISHVVTSGDDVIGVAADGAITALKAGVATVEITAAETEGYAEAVTTVTVTVNKAAVTIKANDKTVKQGAALFTFDYTVSGLANGDKLSFTPVLTRAAADLSILTKSKLKTDALRGISGLQFTMNNTNIPTDLTVAF